MAKSKKKIESKYNAELLRNMIDEGKNAEEIQEALGLATRQSLRHHVMRLMQEERRFIDFPGLYSVNPRLVQVNIKGEVKISAKMVSFPGSTYKYGDKFDIDANNERIVLIRVGFEPAPEEMEEVEVEPEMDIDEE